MTQIKTKTIELPTFEQLTEAEQEKVIANYHDINVDREWYDCIYDDAKSIGIEIVEFSIDRENYIVLKFNTEFQTVAESIIANHGQSTDTYKLATKFIDDIKPLYFARHVTDTLDSKRIIEVSELEDEFKTQLRNEYLSMLKQEYEHMTSEEVIKDTLIANEYTFNRDTLKIDS